MIWDRVDVRLKRLLCLRRPQLRRLVPTQRCLWQDALSKRHVSPKGGMLDDFDMTLVRMIWSALRVMTLYDSLMVGYDWRSVVEMCETWWDVGCISFPSINREYVVTYDSIHNDTYRLELLYFAYLRSADTSDWYPYRPSLFYPLYVVSLGFSRYPHHSTYSLDHTAIIIPCDYKLAR